MTFKSFAAAGTVLVVGVAILQWYNPGMAAIFVALVLLALFLKNPSSLNEIQRALGLAYSGTTGQDRG